MTVRLAERTLTVRTTVTATGDTAVPLCFGFHPYLRLPDVARSEWIIETPPLRHLRLDGRGLPDRRIGIPAGEATSVGRQCF